MNAYITGSGYSDMLYVNPSILASALVDYFADIKRLKAIHDVEHLQHQDHCIYIILAYKAQTYPDERCQ